MNPAVQSHPSADNLRRLTAGHANPEEAAELRRHLAQCPACRDVLRTVSTHATTGSPLGGETDNAPPFLPASGASPSPARTAVPGAETLGLHVDPSATAAYLPTDAVPLELRAHPRYRVLALLGQGGMGAVFRAEHHLMERTVALKVIGRSLTDQPEVVERFRREVKAAARLSHPNIVQAFDADQAGDTHFLVMEFVQGTDLGQCLAERGPLPQAEACDYIRQAALGLQHAFERGMTHRDIKPHNLMRTEEGAIKILDFGLARFASETGVSSSGATAAGTILGTVDYMAPEQAENAHTADVRSDIYALGCTFYHLLTGKVPFPSGTIVQKLRAHADRQPTALRQLRPELPEGIEAVVARMMAKDPARRYQTPAEVAEALSPFIRSEPPLLPAAHGGKPRRRRWSVVVLLGMLALVAAATVITVKTNRGVITIQVEDADIEVVTRKNGDLILIRDTKSGETWNLDTQKLNLGAADRDDGLRIPWNEKKPLVLRRRDGRLVVSISRDLPIAAKPEEPDRPRLSVVELKAGQILVDDNFKDPTKSLFEPEAAADPDTTRLGFAAGLCFIQVDNDETSFLSRGPERQHDDFICQVSGRMSPLRAGAWGMYVESADKNSNSFQVLVRNDGRIEVGPTGWTKKYPAPQLGPIAVPDGFLPGEFNTLVVSRRDRAITIFLNGKRVSKQLALKQQLGKVECGLVGEQYGKGAIRAEFQRYSVWELPPLKKEP